MWYEVSRGPAYPGGYIQPGLRSMKSARQERLLNEQLSPSFPFDVFIQYSMSDLQVVTSLLNLRYANRVFLHPWLCYRSRGRFGPLDCKLFKYNNYAVLKKNTPLFSEVLIILTIFNAEIYSC